MNRGDWWALDFDVASVSVFDYAANIITFFYFSKLLIEKVITGTHDSKKNLTPDLYGQENRDLCSEGQEPPYLLNNMYSFPLL